MCVEDIRVTIKFLDKSKGTRDKKEVGMANKSTKPHKQVCGWLNTMNRQGWHETSARVLKLVSMHDKSFNLVRSLC